MGVYYKCLRGDNEHLGMMEPESVVVRDAAGRNWICHPISEDEVDRLSILGHVSEIHAADVAARKLGAQKGTEVRVYYCENDFDLARRLTETD